MPILDDYDFISIDMRPLLGISLSSHSLLSKALFLYNDPKRSAEHGTYMIATSSTFEITRYSMQH
jgi:hypothetical protein